MCVSSSLLVQVLDKSRKWFRARNIREEEGFVPNNVLEPVEEEEEEHNVYQVHNLTLLRNTLRHCVHRQSDASPSLSHLHEPACRGRAGRSLQRPAHPGLAFGNAVEKAAASWFYLESESQIAGVRFASEVENWTRL